MVMEDVLRYGSIKEGEVYRRESLEIYAEKYRCMLIEDGASRGILAYDPSDDYVILQIIQGAGSNYPIIKYTFIIILKFALIIYFFYFNLFFYY